MNQALTSQSFSEKMPDLPPIPPEMPTKKLIYSEITDHFSLKDVPIRDPHVYDVVQAIKELPESKKRCTRLELRFVQLYIELGRPRQAALQAGYAEATANAAAKWLRSNTTSNDKIHVFLAIYHSLLECDERAIDIAAKTLATAKIDAHFVERKAVEQLDKANADIPAYYVTKVDKDTGEEIKTPVYKYNQQAALKAIELIGRHKHVKAFDNTVEHTSSDLTNLLSSIKTGFKPPNLVTEKDVTPTRSGRDKLPENKEHSPGYILAQAGKQREKSAARLAAEKPKRKRGRPPGAKKSRKPAKK